MLGIDGYIRVSKIGYRRGERFISPSVQREQIFNWAASHETRVLELWEELDESGGRADRPLLESAVQRIERGISGGIVVSKVDRFSRSLLDGLLTIKRIEQAGGGFVSVLDGLDLSTDTGRFILHVMLSMAEWELDRGRTQWHQAMQKAVARGALPQSAPPGYRKTRARRLVPDPAASEAITEAFEMRAAGIPVPQIARFLESRDVRTARGHAHWSTQTATGVLSNPVYLGVVRYGPHVNDHAHHPLTTPEIFHAAQRERRPTKRRYASTALLRGFVRCAGCGFAMNLQQRRLVNGHETRPYFVCNRYTAAGHCPSPASITMHRLEPAVVEIFFDLLKRRRRPPLEEVHRAEHRAIQAQEALAYYRDSDRVRRALGETAYADGLTARVRALESAQYDLASARDRLAMHQLPSYRDLHAAWPTMPLQQQRELLGGVIDVVFVKRGRGGLLSERIMVCPSGTAPAGLPRLGRRRSRMRQYEMRPRWITPTDEAESRSGGS